MTVSTSTVLGSDVTTAALLAPSGAQTQAPLSSSSTPATALSSAAVGTTSPGNTDAKIERAWASAHPDGRGAQSDVLILWNFAIADSTLKGEHEQALRAFLQIRQLSPAVFHLLASGYASKTGSESTNERLRQARADAVAAWCRTAGFTDIGTETGLPGSPDLPPPTEAGEGLAQARAVMLQILYTDADPEPPPPRLALLTNPSEAPSVINCGSKIEFVLAEAKLDLKFPDNPWVVNGNASFKGTVKVLFGDTTACRSAQLALKATGGEAAAKLKAKVSDHLGVVLQATVKPGGSKLELTEALKLGGLEWDFGFKGSQTDGLAVVVKGPEIPVTELVPSNLTAFDWGGVPVKVSVTGRFELSGLPGPAVVELLETWGARLAVAAPEVLVVAGGVGALAFLWLIIDCAASAEANGLRRAAVLAQHMGYLGQLAAVLGHPDDSSVDDQTVEKYLSLYDDSRLIGMRESADSGRKQVMAQLAALDDHGADTIATLHSAYAVGQDGAPADYVRIVKRLNEKAGTMPAADPYNITDF